MTVDPTRRYFISLLPAALAGIAAAAHPAAAGALLRLAGPDHPTPRPGIDASRVLTAQQLDVPAAAPVFDLVRTMPQVADGIRCHCGCADFPGYYSLLSCYEGAGMAQHCDICQGQARLAHRLHGQGWSLDGIRAAIDAAFDEP